VSDALAVLLAGLIVLMVCAGCSSVPQMVTVNVPVPVACVEQAPPRPHVFKAPELKAMDDWQLPLALDYNRLQLELYAMALEAALAGCWQPSPTPGGT
jgi:hypothetical protein